MSLLSFNKLTFLYILHRMLSTYLLWLGEFGAVRGQEADGAVDVSEGWEVTQVDVLPQREHLMPVEFTRLQDHVRQLIAPTLI